MTGNEQFIKLPRGLLESAAFRSIGVNTFRVLHFLMVEHLRRGGRENGNLKAPHRHLVAFGISPRHVATAIRDAEDRGLIECCRGGDASGYDLCIDLAAAA